MRGMGRHTLIGALSAATIAPMRRVHQIHDEWQTDAGDGRGADRRAGDRWRVSDGVSGSAATGVPAAGRTDRPRPAGTKPAVNPGPLILRAEVVDPEGHPLAGADVAVVLRYSRGS